MMKKILQLLGFNLLIGTLTLTAGISFAQPPKYRGYNKCKGCHGKEFESWKEGAMNGEAFKALKPGERTEAKIEVGLDPNKDYTSEAKCLACHATGYGKPGGFVNVADTPDLAGITCEACHGPGEYYWMVMAKKRRTYTLANLVEQAFLTPDQGICDQCHTPGCPMESDTFDYDESSGHDNFPLRYEHPRDWQEARK